MSEYREYIYHNEDLDHTQLYIFEPLISILKNRKNIKVLDLGCGNGSFANKLIDLGFDAYGVDASESGIAIAKKKNAARFFCYDLTSDTIPAEISDISFDIIISTEVIEHIYSPESFMQLCSKILKSGAHREIILSTPYHGFLKNLMLSLTDKWDAHLNPNWEGGHIKFWSEGSLTKLLNNNNFRVLDFVGCGRFPLMWKSMIIHAKLND